MSETAAQSSTAQSEAEKRIVTIKTETGDIVKYSGNPAELPGTRFETHKRLRRARAFKMLIEHNASRLPNGQYATEDLDSVPFVTRLINDPDQANYSYERPCPSTAARVARMNATRALAGQPAYVGVANLTQLPDKVLKLASPNPEEVAIEDHAYALTLLSIFDDE